MVLPELVWRACLYANCTWWFVHEIWASIDLNNYYQWSKIQKDSFFLNCFWLKITNPLALQSYYTVTVLLLKCCPFVAFLSLLWISCHYSECLTCVAGGLSHRYSQFAQQLPQACSELTGISVSLSDWLDSYALCDSTLTYSTLTQHSTICPTERCLIQQGLLYIAIIDVITE